MHARTYKVFRRGPRKFKKTSPVDESTGTDLPRVITLSYARSYINENATTLRGKPSYLRGEIVGSTNKLEADLRAIEGLSKTIHDFFDKLESLDKAKSELESILAELEHRKAHMQENDDKVPLLDDQGQISGQDLETLLDDCKKDGKLNTLSRTMRLCREPLQV